jgi:hypothetical protein
MNPMTETQRRFAGRAGPTAPAIAGLVWLAAAPPDLYESTATGIRLLTT